MTPQTVDIIRWIAYAMLVAAGVSGGFAIPAFRKSRRAPYYILRQNALRRATTLATVAAILIVLAIFMLVLAPRLTSLPATTPEPAITPVPTVAPTATPGSIDSNTPTPRPTATVVPTPTPIQTVSLPDSALSPLPSAVPASEDALVTVTAVAMEKGDGGLPVDPAEVFPPGQHAIYVFFTYEGMANGVPRTFAWYRDGEYLDFCSSTDAWNWGDRGRTSYFCNPSAGWVPGSYEVHIFIETRLMDTAQFVISE